MFWKGAVRLTHNSAAEAAEEAIAILPRVTFKELITGPWNRIILSSYCTDYEWVLDQFEGIGMDASGQESVPITVISHYDRNTEPPGIRTIHATASSSSASAPQSQPRTLNIIYPPFPKFPNYGVMHCKLFLLFGTEYMRVVVSSANLVDYDYSQVQNIVFVQDVPRKRTPSEAIQCQFQSALLSLLEALGAFKSSHIVQRAHIHQYDWSALKANLVYSLPGYVESGAPLASGLSMLNRLVVKRDMAPAEGQDLTVEYQGSSLGSLNRDWIDSFLASARGCLSQGSVKNAAPSSASKKRTIDAVAAEEASMPAARSSDRLRIVFPKMLTVIASPARPEAFTTLFCKESDFKAAVNACTKDNSAHPRNIFYDCVSNGRTGRADYAMHSKIMTVIEGPENSRGSEKTLYHYIGSHNFTASAWGRLVKSGSKLMVCNYEVGVLFESSDLDTNDHTDDNGSGNGNGSISSGAKSPGQCFSFPFPYARPAPVYGDADMPWCQDAKISQQSFQMD